MGIRECNKNNCLTLWSNGGQQEFRKKADLKLLPLKVVVNKKPNATILSLKDIADLPDVRLTMDTDKDSAIILHLHNGSTLHFVESGASL